MRSAPLSTRQQQTVEKDFATALQLYRTRRLGEAEALCRKFLARTPRHAAGLHLLGTIALQTGRNADAVDCLVRAAVLRPADADIRNLLGAAYVQLDRLPDAIASLETALRLRSDFPEAQCTLGVALAKVGRSADAVAAFHAALRVNPNLVQAHFNLAGILETTQPATAIEHYHAVLRLEPDNIIAHYERGRLLAADGRTAEALSHFREVVRLEPSYTQARINIGVALAVLERWDEALDQMQETVRLEPQSAEAHHNLSSVLLRLGRLAEGFEQYEWRWRLDLTKPHLRPFRQARWQGEDVSGKSLLLHDEQGLGDALQFSRYVPLAIERGARVHLEVAPELVRLLELSFGAPTLHIIPRVASFPDVEGLPETDYQAPLMSMAHVLGASLATIPATVPYLRADPAQAKQWSARLSSLPGPRVGLVWAGRPQNQLDHVRSISLERLAPLADAARMTFVSLQKGEAAGQAAAPPRGMAIHDFTADLHDLADTAALIEALDLVISVDTAVAHLAGALGKPVWVMNRLHSDWRWLIGRDDTPWYPTMRVFRQPRHGDWEAVIARVTGELRGKFCP
jgi:tetratricopeptide (TPR) repeat protein